MNDESSRAASGKIFYRIVQEGYIVRVILLDWMP
ncbi:hypothetical protein RLEG3_04465 (plasmid) [Rhizobium leguminosarum bv. trifolii WSM1689]|nr:hypothetical protein RLEG3_04465 [Rhizobium leguminosarum bv. trifolii WSM1689]